MALIALQCRQNKETETVLKPVVMESTIQQAIDSLIQKYGNAQRERITSGVKLTSSFWQATDGR